MADERGADTMSEKLEQEAREGFAPCPTCKQYSHSLGGDQLAEAFMHFQMMFSHRGGGIPTQFVFGERTRDAAQVLIAAARGSGWRPIDTAPKDGSQFIAYSQDLAGCGLPPLISLCAWHDEAGFCTDEIREPTDWHQLPPPPKEHDDERR